MGRQRAAGTVRIASWAVERDRSIAADGELSPGGQPQLQRTDSRWIWKHEQRSAFFLGRSHKPFVGCYGQMSAPRHLWFGDWRDDSAALAEELAARRADGSVPPAEAEPEVASPAAVKGRPRRPFVRLRRVDPRRLRTALLVALLTFLVAGGAYAVASGGNERSPNSPTAAAGSTAWLGVDMATSPVGGVMVVGVAAHSPAQAAGIKPGDLITQIDTEPIAAPSIVEAAIAGLRPGDQVEIQLQRGSTTYTAHVTLATPPARNP